MIGKKFKQGFPTGFEIAVISYCHMSINCYLGQVVVDRVRSSILSVGYRFIEFFPHSVFQNNKIRDALYSELKFYLLPVELQKDVIHMINHMQNGILLKIAPFGPLSLESLKTVSFRAILMEFFSWEIKIFHHNILIVSVNATNQFICYVFNQFWTKRDSPPLNCSGIDVKYLFGLDQSTF